MRPIIPIQLVIFQDFSYVQGSVLYVYDAQPSDALATFTHEVIEFKLMSLTRIYRTLINNLIDGYEKLAYQEKEDFIDFIPRLIEAQKNRSTNNK